ncbi:hypothetical protein GIB67_040242 [Kingdonia uniflora]|uniref:Uncharacterized protein n=1 Tax=Kingdonia uniflora TaxID=39325 RepID=A0A7J7MVK8_9MAGN|nr:hypothetical protein GIB67_040242 [Kingdonia uniflora]
MWWTDGKGRTFINFLVNSLKRTVFLKSIDGSAHIHDAELIYKMLKDVIEEICTDNASNCVLAGDWIMAESKIYWMPCAAHCVNLILGDVSKMHLVEETVKDAKKISLFIYNHKHVLHLMRKQTKGREIRNSKWPKHPIGKEIMKKVKSNTFWNNMHTCLKIMAPLVDVIRMVDTEEKPYMAYIYSAIKDYKLKVKTNLEDQNEDHRELWKKMKKILDRRWFGWEVGKEGCLSLCETIAPVEWWIIFGSKVPALQRFVKRVLGLTSADSPCERIWSTFDNIHTKKMNCLEHDRMRDLAYIEYNKRLKKRYEERISGKERPNCVEVPR